jgi:hypothetical protein
MIIIRNYEQQKTILDMKKIARISCYCSDRWYVAGFGMYSEFRFKGKTQIYGESIPT